MRKLILALGFFSLVSLCSSQILKIDFSGYSIGPRWSAYYVNERPIAPWTDVSVFKSFSGTFIYNADLLQESFTQNGDYWRWQYQTSQQVSMSVTLNGATYNNTSDYPYGSLTSYSAYEPIETYIYSNGKWELVTRNQKSNIFKVAYQDQSSCVGTVYSMNVQFGYEKIVLPGLNPQPTPFEPVAVFDSATYSGKTLSMQVNAYSSTGEWLGIYRQEYVINSYQVSVIPEPSTILLLGVGYVIQRLRGKRRL